MKVSSKLTSGFLGDVLSAVGVVPVLAVNFMYELDEAMGSFLGEVLILEGEMRVLLVDAVLFSSSLFFIMASLELALTGERFFLGVGLITSSDLIVVGGLLGLPAAESVQLFLGNAA